MSHGVVGRAVAFLHIFVVQSSAQAIFLFPFPLGIEKKFFSKSCLEFQCSHLYVNIFFVSLITKKWLFAKIRHSKSSGVLLIGIFEPNKSICEKYTTSKGFCYTHAFGNQSFNLEKRGLIL